MELIEKINTLKNAIVFPAASREIANGQSHLLEVVITILIVVVIGIFMYTVGVPAIEALWNNAMAAIGTIQP